MELEYSHKVSTQILLIVILLLGHARAHHGGLLSRSIHIVSSPRQLKQAERTLLSPQSSLSQQKAALLSFKEALTRSRSSNARSFVNWTDDSDPCAWRGVQCIGMNVAELDLSNQNLSGPIPQELINLSFLTSISLASNAFNGSIPQEVVHMYNLVNLTLSYNNLTGGIPQQFFANCDNLQMINLSGNPLGGSIPSSIQNCKSLKWLDLSSSLLEGAIPDGLGQIWTLEILLLHNNKLVGPIPRHLFDTCQNLQTLDLSTNNLTGGIPPQIENCSRLLTLSISRNQIDSVPRELGNLEQLQHLSLGENKLSTIDADIGGCTSLRALILNSNYFSGTIPSFFSQFHYLEVLMLYDNKFEGEIPMWITELHHLYHLDVSGNQLIGSIPNEIVDMKGLKFLVLANNKLTGGIPTEIGKMTALQFLDLSSNQLTGSLPKTLGNLQNLLWLMLAHNRITGELPIELANCSSLLWLNLQDNSFSGPLPQNIGDIGANVSVTFEKNKQTLPEMPRSVGGCSMVRRWLPSTEPPFDLVLKVLDTERCRVFWNMLLRGEFMYPLCSKRPTQESLGYIQLSKNLFTSIIPESIGRNAHLGLLFLGQNNFTGEFLSNMSTRAITGINVAGNILSGQVPATLGDLSCLVTLDLSLNNFSGNIPSELQKLTQLSRFNISYNPLLTGEVPTQQQFATFDASVYSGDDNLCISSSNGLRTSTAENKIPVCRSSDMNSDLFPRRSSGMAVATILGITLACLLALIIFLLISFFTFGRNPSTPPASLNFMMVGSESNRFGDASVQVSLFAIELPKHLSYADLLSATNNFDESNIVGSGGFGVVYKAKLVDGSIVAIKKLIQEGPQADREFLAEMETLGHVHHENLVPLMGCSSYGTEKLLVYRYMENGSLDDWLHERPGGPEALVWPLRLNVALGMARGLKFLHHNCSPPIVHRDMKASNILLDENFEPRLTDFGLARIIGSQETHVSTVVAGTLGYVPPEYCQTWRATTKGDVYSFGVVLLELITGKRPMSIFFSEKNCGNLVEWVNIHLKEGSHTQTYDPVVVAAGAPAELVAFLKLGVSCTAELPIKRPTMREVLRVLEEIKAGNYTAAVTIQMRQRSIREST